MSVNDLGIVYTYVIKAARKANEYNERQKIGLSTYYSIRQVLEGLALMM